jgi:hypothetical protein
MDLMRMNGLIDLVIKAMLVNGYIMPLLPYFRRLELWNQRLILHMEYSVV